MSPEGILFHQKLRGVQVYDAVAESLGRCTGLEFYLATVGFQIIRESRWCLDGFVTSMVFEALDVTFLGLL
ncbi:MAG: hypothetical protein M2R45_04078 [Verrucomicrobia subdivision 3 bacterium]|nr:hypothetical protein [Limisphaerales bacterium]MCS1417017.1 hypothetical protein [Limisphaerales bacterium]